MKRRITLIFSILLIIIGYTLTQTTGIRGKAYLFPGETEADIHTFVADDTREVLPFQVSSPLTSRLTPINTVSEPVEGPPSIYLVNVDSYGKPLFFLGFIFLCLTLIASLRHIRWQVLTGAIALSALYFSLRYIIRSVPPMLQSPWLYFHVTTVMTAYALFIIIAIRPDRRVHLWAVTFLAIGILLGSIWADQAWNSYWSWDPKETWALITLIIYSIPLIHPFDKRRASEPPTINTQPGSRACRGTTITYKLYLRLALLAVLMTYFGVNYFLGGLHSYA